MNISHELNVWQKTVALAVWCGAGAVFLTVGWEAVSLRDPMAAVSVLITPDALPTWVQLIMLAGVTSAIATIVLGRILPDAGVFAASFGLAVLGLRGGTTEYILMQRADAQSIAPGSLTVQLVTETLAWVLVLLTAVIVSAATSRWFFGTPTWHEHLSGGHLPIVGRWLGGQADPQVQTDAHPGESADHVVPYGAGLRHTAFVAVAMFVLMSLMSVDSAHRPILHGQVCFVVAAAAWIATYYGFRFFPVRSALWSLLAIPLVSVLAYLWSGVIPAESTQPANLPVSAMLRPLPVQYVAVGFASVMAAFWCVHRCAADTPAE